MGIKPRNLHRKHFPHPNVVMVPIVRAAIDNERFLVPTVLSTITSNAPITLTKPWMPGSAANVVIKVAQAASESAPTVTWRVRGKNQFGESKESTKTVSAFAGQATTEVYSEIDEIVITSDTAGLASEVEFGMAGGTGERLGIPVHVTSSVVGDLGQVVSVVTDAGVVDTDYTIDLTTQSFVPGGSSAMRNAGTFYVKFNFGAEANP